MRNLTVLRLNIFKKILFTYLIKLKSSFEIVVKDIVFQIYILKVFVQCTNAPKLPIYSAVVEKYKNFVYARQLNIILKKL